ncbi:MAG: RagB/SusD family nutrient uptake outer membrane protein [Prolixibacteraceae bacterium]|nr:RagB/SusD family nutrient uptake outer membrane protein [Prolixibacteraceae bacterium]
MKNILNKVIISGLIILALGACKEDFLETVPTSSVSESSVFATTSNAMMALNGIHRSMFMQYSNQDEAGQGSINIHLDMLGEDLVMHSTGNGWFNATYQWSSTRNANGTNVYFFYRFYYKIIANANMIITNVNKAVGPAETKKMIRGQAMAYRAYAHFQLVQLFAKRYDAGTANDQMGVPIMTTNTTEGLPRASVADVYKQINLDLDSAVIYLTGAAARTAKSHIDIPVVKGIKARVALTQQNWADAAKYANEARQGYKFMSAAQHLEGYNSTANPEWIWGSTQISDQQTYFYSFFAYMSFNFSSTNIRGNPKKISKALYDQISATDVRKGLWLLTPARPAITLPTTFTLAPYMNRKFLANGTSMDVAASSVGDITYMRAAEMYLIEAEALARQNKDTEAQDALFLLANNRDSKYVKSTKTGTDLVNEILLQRRIELWGEGFRFLDLKRLNAKLDRTGSNHNTALAVMMTVEPGDILWQFMIPKAELDANPAIKDQQNP